MGSCQLSVLSSQLKVVNQRSAFRLLLIVMVMIAGCGATSTPTPEAIVPAVMPKILATVYISPTPDAAQLEATRAAVPPTITQPPSVPTTVPTAYVGVFLGEAEVAEVGPAMVPQMFNPPTEAPPITIAPTCPAQADPLFGTRWAGEAALVQALGCPVELVSAYDGKLQVFERGVMYSRPGGEVWAISPSAETYWYVPVALPAPPNMVVPPAGLLAPSAEFLPAWQAAQGLSDALGFARLEAQDAAISTQRFQGGVLLADGSSGQVFLLLANGTAHGPY